MSDEDKRLPKIEINIVHQPSAEELMRRNVMLDAFMLCRRCGTTMVRGSACPRCGAWCR